MTVLGISTAVTNFNFLNFPQTHTKKGCNFMKDLIFPVSLLILDVSSNWKFIAVALMKKGNGLFCSTYLLWGHS